MKTLVRLGLLLILLSSSLHAQSQSEMNQEAARDAARADKELNKVYKQLLGTLDEEGVKLLKESQRAWIAYRDAEAKFSADDARGGSMAPLLYSGTLATLTNQRVKLLKEHLGDDAAAPKEKPQEEPKPIIEENSQAGAKTQHQAAQNFFDAYKNHDRRNALKYASDTVIKKLVWDAAAGDNPSLKLMDDSHIYYEGGSIQLKLQKTKAGRWIVADVGMTAD